MLSGTLRRIIVRPLVSRTLYVRHKMSFAPAYSYVTANELARLWKEQHATMQAAEAATQGTSSRSIEIVDVRDDDYEGGHIRGAWNVPSVEVGDRLDEMLNKLRGAQTVVFHCSLSQARGPKAARKYAEAREAAVNSGKLPSGQQTVQVLRDGFSNFGAKYKNDQELVEDYDEESWKYR